MLPMGQTPMDHMTLVLVNHMATVNFTYDFHYTARGLTFGTVLINGGPVQFSNLVYNYDYRLDRFTNTSARTNQVNQNDYRYPKRYTGDTTAAQSIFGAPQIRNDVNLLDDYNSALGGRRVQALVNEFWQQYPKLKVVVSSAWQDDSLSFPVYVRTIGGNRIYGPIETSSQTGIVYHYGHSINQAEVRVPGIIDDWTTVTLGASYSDHGGRYSVGFV